MRLHRSKERAFIAKVMLDLVYTVHRGRLESKRSSLTGEIELVLMAAVVLLGHVNGKRKTAAEIGRSLGLPRITARRKLEELMRRGVVGREGTRYSVIDNSCDNFRYVDASLAIIRRAAPNSRPK